MNYKKLQNLVEASRNSLNGLNLDENSQKLASSLIEELNKLEPTGDDGRREIWIKLQRPEINEVLDYDDLVYYGEVSNKEEYYKYYEDWYPKDRWFNIITFDYVLRDEKYQYIIINNGVIYQNPPVTNDYPIDISDVLKGIIKEIKKLIPMINNEYNDTNEYNEYIEKNLPGNYRYGLLLRSIAYSKYPKLKEIEYDELSEEEVNKFLSTIDDEITTFKDFTSSLYFKYCYSIYKENGYDLDKLTPKEAYLKYSDGRDDDLREVDEKSPIEFKNWLQDRNKSGHPWEIIRGGNSTHVSLYPLFDKEKGTYKLLLAGKYRTKETIKAYIALKKLNITPDLSDKQFFIDRFTGLGYYGIIPDDQPRVYQESSFDIPVIDFINFYELETPNLQNDVVLYPLVKVKRKISKNSK